MRFRRVGRLAAALLMAGAAAGCSGGAASRCPKPIEYDPETLRQISEALRALPRDNILHRAMEDYENERDDIRFLRCNQENINPSR